MTSGSSGHGVIERLLDRVPELQRPYEQHLEDNLGDLLPHVFMGEVTRWVAARMTTPSTDGRHAAAAVVDVLEAVMRDGVPGHVELVAVSFVENLDRRAAYFPQVHSTMGPLLRREVATQDGRSPGGSP